MSSRKDRPEFFSNNDAGKIFMDSFIAEVGARRAIITEQYVSAKNVAHFHHLGPWSDPANPAARDTDLQAHSTSMSTSFQDLVDNKLEILDRSINQMTNDMREQFARLLYSTISAACDQSGNTVDAGNEGLKPHEAFRAAIEKIEFGVDKYENVELPTMHVGQGGFEKMRASLDEASEEFKAEFEALKERKATEAITRERARKALFVKYGELR